MADSHEPSQYITLKWLDPVDSSMVNRRQNDIRPIGVYKGGHVETGVGNSVVVGSVVCEIGYLDAGVYHQVRVETLEESTLDVTSVNKYITARWQYSGSANDKLTVQAISEAQMLANSYDLLLAVCEFDGGGGLTSVSYYSGGTFTNPTYKRSTPEVQHKYLKVVPTDTPGASVMLCAGRFQTLYGYAYVPEQKILLTGYTKPCIVYVGKDGIVGAASAVGGNPPPYDGRLVVAEISGVSPYTADKIKDVRNFITPSRTGRQEQAVGTDDITTNNDSFTLMKDMSISMNTYGGNVLCLFTASLDTTSGHAGRVRLAINSVQKCNFKWDMATGSDRIVVSFHWLEKDLSPGYHTFQIDWRKMSGQDSIKHHADNGPRLFTVIEL